MDKTNAANLSIDVFLILISVIWAKIHCSSTNFHSQQLATLTGSRTLRPQDTSATRHFGHKTLRPQDTSATRHFGTTKLVPRRITGGAVSHRNCPGSKCPSFSSITALVSKCLEIGAEVSQSVLMPKCVMAAVSSNSSTQCYCYLLLLILTANIQ